MFWEKCPIGGNSNFTSGGMKGCHNKNSPALLKTLTKNAKYAEEWLVDDLGAQFCFRKECGGQSFALGHGSCDDSAVGPEILRVLTKHMAADKIDIRHPNQVVEILMKNDRVVGVKVKTSKGESTIDAKAVVLAIGGFSANHAMVESIVRNSRAIMQVLSVKV